MTEGRRTIDDRSLSPTGCLMNGRSASRRGMICGMRYRASPTARIADPGRMLWGAAATGRVRSATAAASRMWCCPTAARMPATTTTATADSATTTESAGEQVGRTH